MITIKPEALQTLKELTANNDHGECYKLAASYLMLDELAEKFDAINRRHIRLGYLDYDLSQKRYALYQDERLVRNKNPPHGRVWFSIAG